MLAVEVAATRRWSRELLGDYAFSGWGDTEFFYIDSLSMPRASYDVFTSNIVTTAAHGDASRRSGDAISKCITSPPAAGYRIYVD